MGAGTLSKPAGAGGSGIDVDFDQIVTYSAHEIAAIVTGFGAAYEPYGQKIIDNGIDGRLLGELGVEELSSIVQTLGVANAIHAVKISLFFKSFKEKQLGVALPPTPSIASPKAAMSPSRSASNRKVRRTSIGHSVEKQESSHDALASLRASLVSDAQPPVVVVAEAPNAAPVSPPSASPPAEPAALVTSTVPPVAEPALAAAGPLSSP